MSADTLSKLLYLLKTRGPLTAQQLAAILELTSMGRAANWKRRRQAAWCNARTGPQAWGALAAGGRSPVPVTRAFRTGMAKWWCN
jgi:hypothetical protein